MMMPLPKLLKKRFNVDDPIANQVAQQANGSFTEAVSLLDQSEDRKANFDRLKIGCECAGLSMHRDC